MEDLNVTALRKSFQLSLSCNVDLPSPTDLGQTEDWSDWTTERGLSSLDSMPDIDQITLYLNDDEKLQLLNDMLCSLMCIDVKFNKISLVENILDKFPLAASKPSCASVSNTYPHHLAVVRYCGSNNPSEESEQYLICDLLGKAYPKGFNECNSYGEFPLHLLCSHPTPCIHTLKLLLRYASNTVSEATVSGKCPLHVIMRSHRSQQNHHEVAHQILLLLHISLKSAMISVHDEWRQLQFLDGPGIGDGTGGRRNASYITHVKDWTPYEMAIEENLDWFINYINKRIFEINSKRVFGFI